jgi:hypothetical protein
VSVCADWVLLVLTLCLLALPVEASVQGETIKGAHYVVALSGGDGQ